MDRGKGEWGLGGGGQRGKGTSVNSGNIKNKVKKKNL